MNTVVTSRQALLAASRTVARRQGLDGLSIRAVAAEARVSVGSVYNYFSGKTELLAATVEEIWMQILSAPEGEAPRDGFAAYVHWLFHRIQSGAGEYPGFFQGHAAGFCELAYLKHLTVQAFGLVKLPAGFKKLGKSLESLESGK